MLNKPNHGGEHYIESDMAPGHWFEGRLLQLKLAKKGSKLTHETEKNVNDGQTHYETEGNNREEGPTKENLVMS